MFRVYDCSSLMMDKLHKKRVKRDCVMADSKISSNQ